MTEPLPQKFRIGDTVCLAAYAPILDRSLIGVPGRVLGVFVDRTRTDKVAYAVNQFPYVVPEDWLEAAEEKDEYRRR